ncbi:MAG: type II secretion system protein GspM [Candidatus Nitrospinota bacterium M3_3B_026]
MNALASLTPRERVIVLLGSLFAVIVLSWIAVYEPAAQRHETLARKIESKERELAEVSALARKYVRMKEGFDRLNRRLKGRPRDFSPLSELESLAGGAGARDSVASMTPLPPRDIEGYTESLIKIEMEKTTLPELVRLLKAMRESGAVFRVKRVSIKPEYDDPSRLDVSMTVAAYGAPR